MVRNEASRRPGDPESSGFRREATMILVLSLAVALAALAVASFGAARPAEGATNWTVVDNAHPTRFLQPAGWTQTRALAAQNYHTSHAYARPGKAAPARFKVNIPQTGSYAVFARWPAHRGHNQSTPIGVFTTSGWKFTRVNQRTNGNRWVRLGTFQMGAGDIYNIMVSRAGRGAGLTVADAVAVARVNAPAARHPDAILGRPIHSQAKVASYARSKGSTQVIMQTIPHYYRLGPRVGIAPDFLVAQAMLETGYGRYGGDSRPWNMAGVKKRNATGDTPSDFEVPPNAYEGARMHVNHMAAYTGRPTIGNPHGRYYVARDIQRSKGFWVRRVSQLGGGVWATDPNYAPKLRSILNEM